MESGIYALINQDNGKVYIGRTIDSNKRKTTHFWMLKANRHPNNHLQSAWNNGNRFTFEIIEECEPSRCNEREIFWIQHFDSMRNGYNQSLGGETNEGWVCSDETKEKLSESAKGRKFSKETIEKRIQTLKKHFEDDPEFYDSYIKNQREKNIGKQPWNKGMKCPEDQKRRVSEKLRGRVISDSHKEKLRELYSGERSLTAKLTREEAVQIKILSLSGEMTLAEIAERFPKVGKQSVWDIKVARRWKDLPNNIDELRKLTGVCINNDSKMCRDARNEDPSR